VNREKPKPKILTISQENTSAGIVVLETVQGTMTQKARRRLEGRTREGDSPVRAGEGTTHRARKGWFLNESGCLRVQPEMGGILLLRLNMGGRPIAYKYREGKMKRPWKECQNNLKLLKEKRLEDSEGVLV